MISGFNTDIEFGNTVYHVQTEDKGLRSRLIVSLVYDKGTILASKRASYEDLADSNFDEKVLTERLNRQHQLICKAVSAGRIDELKAMAAKDRSKAEVAEVATPEIAVPPVPHNASAIQSRSSICTFAASFPRPAPADVKEIGRAHV